MAKLKIGQEVKWRDDKDAPWNKGVIHGIKKAEAVKGPDIILGYLVDTGGDYHIDEFKTPKGEEDIIIRQPEQVEVSPEHIEAV